MEGGVCKGTGSDEVGNFSLAEDTADGRMSRLPDVKFVNESDIGIIGVIDFFEKSDLYFPQGWRATCLGGILDS